MNHKLTIAAAVAVILASTAEFALIHGAAWFFESAGAVIIVALAGTLTRASQVPAAIGATLLAVAATVPLLAAQSVYLKVAAGVIIICCAASASGLRPLRAVAGLATYLSALLLYLNAIQAGGQSIGVVIPTGRSLHHLASLVSYGTTLTKASPPVPGQFHSIQLLAAGSIGLAAIVVDYLAVRLHKPAIAGLPLLVVFMAPIATTAKIGGLGEAAVFLLAAIGYLALLSADGRNRLRGWGRVVTVWHSAGEDERLGGADMSVLSAAGRRIGFAAVCAAIVVPLLLPTLNLHRIFSGGSGDGTVAPVGLPDPVDQLHGLLTASGTKSVLTYRSNAGDNGNYLQVYVLNYDKALSQWDLTYPNKSTTVTAAPLLSAPGLSDASQSVVTTHITLGHVVAGYSSPLFFLPAPYWPMQLSIGGKWREADGSLMLFSDSADHFGQRYSVINGELDPTPAQLTVPQVIPASIKSQYLGFSSAVTGQLAQIADNVTKGKVTAYAKAVALERWFHSGLFTYDLASTDIPNTPQGLLAFLKTNRHGYCQQFAFAMAVLARLVGIPSRVAIGYTAGTRQRTGSWLVTSADAHAWPELYFSGVGWLRFEPTPGGTGGQDTAVQPAYVTNARASNEGPSTTRPNSTGPSSGPSSRASAPNQARHFVVPEGGGAGGSAPTSSASPAVPLGEAVGALLVLAAILPVTIRAVTRRRRWRAARTDAGLAEAAWREFCADLEDYGRSCRPSESPRTVARRITAEAGLDEPAREAVSRIATVVERARYARLPDPAGRIRSDVTTVRRGLARSSLRITRWRARLLPASTLRPFSESVRNGLGAITGWTAAPRESRA
jgi:transglutaminase-like putative cysteine protease